MAQNNNGFCLTEEIEKSKIRLRELQEALNGKVIQREHCLREIENARVRKEWIKLQVQRVDHQVTMIQGSKGALQKGNEDEATKCSSSVSPLSNLIPAYNWFKGIEGKDPRLYISGQTKVSNFVEKKKKDLQKFYVSAYKSGRQIEVIYNKSKIRIPLTNHNSNPALSIHPHDNTHPNTELNEELAPSLDSNDMTSNYGTTSFFNNRSAAIDEEILSDLDDDDEFSYNEDDSITSKKSGRLNPKAKLARRKDPQHKTNRYKFQPVEDEIIKTQILEKIFANPSNAPQTLQNVKEQEFYHRPGLELARRCMELIQAKAITIPPNFNNMILEEAKNDNDSYQNLIQFLREAARNPEKELQTYTRKWTEEEDQQLLKAVERHGYGNWCEVANYLNFPNPRECRYHYTKIDPKISKKDTWNKLHKDVELILGVKMFGEAKWAEISEHIFHKNISDTQCLERYQNILDPRVSHLPFTEEEDRKLRSLVSNKDFKEIKKWTQIVRENFSNRTDNQVKRRVKTLRNMDLKERQEFKKEIMQKKTPLIKKQKVVLKSSKVNLYPFKKIEGGGSMLGPIVSDVNAFQELKKKTLGKRMEREQKKFAKNLNENPETTVNNKKRNIKKEPKPSIVKLEAQQVTQMMSGSSAGPFIIKQERHQQ